MCVFVTYKRMLWPYRGKSDTVCNSEMFIVFVKREKQV